MKYADYLKLEKKPENHVIGYFAHDDIFESLTASDIFVAIDESWDYEGNITCYAPIGQHSALSVELLESDDVIEIKKSTYLKISEGIYTPQDYIEELSRMNRTDFEEMLKTYNTNNVSPIHEVINNVETYQIEVENYYNIVVVLSNDDIKELNNLYFSKEK